MAITLKQVMEWLGSDEPNYKAAVKLGVQVLPHLAALVQSNSPEYAAKAASLASFIDDDRAVEVLGIAARHPSPIVRLAAAGGARHMKRPPAANILMALLDDRDHGVRKLAVKSAVIRPNSALLAKIASLGRTDPHPQIRLLASRVASGTRPA